LLPIKQFTSTVSNDILSPVRYMGARKAVKQGHLYSASVLPIRSLPLAPSPVPSALSLSQTAPLRAQT